MKFKLPSRKNAFRWLIISIIVLVVGLYVVLPFVVAVIAVFPSGKGDVGAPPAGFEEVSLKTSDDLNLAAWYAPPQNGAAIIVFPGAGGSRSSQRDRSEMLANHGFGVLALDPRGRGESDGKINRYGWKGTLDVGAAIAFLREQPDVKTIGGIGTSMGGEVLLGAASTYPEIKAIVADGATARSTGEYRSLPKNEPFVRYFVKGSVDFWVGIFTGEDQPEPTLLESIKAADTTAYLFLAAGNNSEEIEYNEMFVEAVGEQGTLWIVPDVDHTKAYSRYPDEYEQRVIGFFEDTLLAG